MKKVFLTASLLSLSMLALGLPVPAEEAHHPENQPAAQMDTAQVEATFQKMQELRQRIQDEKDPAARQELMHQHMQMMRAGMDMMGGQGGMMMDQGGDMGVTGGDSRTPKPCCKGTMMQ